LCYCIAATQGYFHYTFIKKVISTGFTLGKQERLKSRKLLEQLFKEGKSFFVHPIKVYYQPLPLESTSPLQAAFGVSARAFKKAVDRNRIKRLMREAYRLQKPEFAATIDSNTRLAIFFLYVGKELPDYQVVKDKMEVILKRLVFPR
jgi:ribonuclease P protein component